MVHGSEDYYNPDAQLAASLTKLDAVVGKLNDSIAQLQLIVGGLGDVLASIGENIGTISSDIKTLLTTIRQQAMGTATSMHASGTGETGFAGAVKTIISAWAGRTGFSVTNTGPETGRLCVGGSNSCSMATLNIGGYYTNETYCGAVKVKGTSDNIDYAFEEW